MHDIYVHTYTYIHIHISAHTQGHTRASRATHRAQLRHVAHDIVAGRHLSAELPLPPWVSRPQPQRNMHSVWERPLQAALRRFSMQGLPCANDFAKLIY